MISVCLACYNGDEYIRTQIESILSQLSDSDELIISDDGSKDDTIQIIESFNDARIKLFINHGPHGVNKNFENALSKASGDYIFLSDQDDIWLPNKVNFCLKVLRSADCVIHDCYITDNNLNTISKSLFNEIDAGPGFFRNLRKNTFTGCCMAFSKDVLRNVLPIPSSRLFYHDQWIGLITSLSFTTIFLHERLIYFRRHSANASSAAKKSQLSIKGKLLSRISLANKLLVKYLKFNLK